MAVFTIPLIKDIYQYTPEITIEGVTYTFHFNYNRRYGRWTMGIEGQFLAVPLLSGIDLLGQLKHLDVPQGRLEMIDKEGKFNEADLTNLGDTLIMQYTEA